MTPAAGPSRRTVAIWVSACCALTLLAKLDVTAPRRLVSHGDISFYYAVAKNLVAGRGFVIDYVWNFWNHPTGIPTFSNDWWMPLTSVLSAIGMWIGGVSFVAAQTAMIVVTSALPLVVYLLGRELWGHPGVGMVGALLTTTFHLFLDKASAPLSHAPYVVLASLALWLIVRSMRDPRSWKWAGAAIGMATLARSDSIVLFGALSVAALLARPRPGWRALALAPLCWAAVMSPWWVHNLVVLGTPQPGGSMRAAFLTEYEAWYALPESVTFERWRAQGWDTIVAQKGAMAAVNLGTAAHGLVSGAADRDAAWRELAGLRAWLGGDGPWPPDLRRLLPLFGLLLLAWVGLCTTFRRRFAPFWTLWGLEWAFYSLVFTAVGEESFRTGMFSVYPTLVLCAAAGLLQLARAASQRLPARWGRESTAAAIVLLVAGTIVAGQLAFAREAMLEKVKGIDNLNQAFTALRRDLFERHGLQDEVVMAREVHQLNTIAGMKGVMIPYESEPVIREVAARYGARYLLLVNDLIVGHPSGRSLRPGLSNVANHPHYEQVEEAKAFGYRFLLYRIKD